MLHNPKAVDGWFEELEEHCKYMMDYATEADSHISKLYEEFEQQIKKTEEYKVQLQEKIDVLYEEKRIEKKQK